MTPEPTVARRVLTGLVLAVALLAAVVVQVTVVNRLPLPGRGAPDLVLLLVTAIAVRVSPLAGAVSGFAGGLALDVAPPAAHYAGEYALLFCLAGYGAGRLVSILWDLRGERVAAYSLAFMAAAAAAGEAGKALLGIALADPDVTGAVVRQVLPGAVLYDLVLAPVVFLLVARLTREVAAESAPLPEFSYAQRLAGAFRQASAGAAPDLRLSGSGASYQRPAPARAVPRLRLADGRSSARPRTGAASARGPASPLAAGRTPKLNFAASSPRSAPRRPRRPGRSWLKAAGAPSLGGAAFRSRAGHPRGRAPKAGWLHSARSPALSGSSASGLRSPRRGWAGHPGRSRTVLGSTARGGSSPFRRRRLSQSGLSRARLSQSGLSPARFSRSGRARRRFSAGVPSGAWLTQGRHPWRKRRQRLLRLVGVGR